MNQVRPSPDTTARPANDAPADEALHALRRKLDGVDAALHHLLTERMGIVTAIADAKGSGAPVIRADREATVLSNRLAADESAPAELVATVWRALTSTACMVQRPYRVHATRASAEAAVLLHMAAPVLRHAAAASALAALGDAAEDLAILADTDVPWGDLGPAHALLAADSAAGRFIVFGGADVEPADGPLALIRSDSGVRASDQVLPGDEVVARVHLYPVPLPVSVSVP